jgi:phenylacetate-CoA ligase
VEVVDPETHQPLGEGERGELVITSLQHEAFPLIRYFSRDVTAVSASEKCGCGMSHPMVSADIDRQDFMVKARGVPVFPSHVEVILGEFSSLTGNCQIVVDKRTPSQDVALRVEVKRALAASEEKSLRAQIVEQVKNRVGFTVNDLTFVPKGTFRGKFQKTVAIV